MRKKNKLYTANRWNQPLFAQNVDRENYNIFDGEGASNLGGWPTGTPAASAGSWPSTVSTGGFHAAPASPPSMSPSNLQPINLTPSAPSAGQMPHISMPKPSSGGGFSLGSMGDPKSIAGAGIGALGTMVGAGASSLLSHGLSSGAGKAITNIGGQLGGAISKVNPLAGTIVSVGSGIIGGATNALFGTSVDQEKLNAANEGTDKLNSFRSTASSFDNIQGPQAVAAVQNAYKGGVFKKGWAAKRNAALKAQRADAISWANRSVDNNIDNIASTQMDNALANYAAFGGPLGDNQGAVDYGFMSDYLNTKNRAASARDRVYGGIFGGMTPSQPGVFALGGDIQMNGADFSNGLSEINAGGSHEENPYQGVQVGISQENGKPNLVEEGETIFDDYVFSKRIKIDNKTKKKFHLSKHAKLSYADLSKRLQRESLERPNDAISQQGLTKQLHALAEEQERQKAEMEAKKEREAFESLSPEQQAEMMQAVAMQQQEAQEQQAMQQEQMQQQEMQAQQEGQQMQEGQMQQQAQEQQMQQQEGMQGEGYAYGGRINRFDNGGNTQAKRKRELYNAIGGIYTDDDFDAWAKENKVDPIKDWDNVWKNTQVTDAIGKKNPALKDAILRGYDFGSYTAPKGGVYNLEDFKNRVAAYDKSNTPGNTKGNYVIDNEFDLGKHKTIADLEKDPKYTAFTDYVANALGRMSGISFTRKNLNEPYSYDNIKWKDPAKTFSREDWNTFETLKQIANQTSINPDHNTALPLTDYEDGYDTLAEGVADKFRALRNDGKGGVFHLTPDPIVRNNNLNNYEIKADNSVVPIYGDIPKEWEKGSTYNWQTPDGNYTANYYRRPETIEELAKKGKTKMVAKHNPEWLRYAGILGSVGDIGMRLAGVGKPDNSDFENTQATYSSTPPSHVSPELIGDKVTYKPTDINYTLNKLSAQANATNRAIMDNSAPVTTKNASMIDNSYKSQLAQAEALRAADEYNFNKYYKVADFNRSTNMFNAEALTRASEFNAGVDNNRAWQLAQLGMQTAREKAEARASWYRGLYNSYNNIFNTLGDIGRENKTHNMVADMAADGIFGTLKNQNISNGFLKEVPIDEEEKKKKRKKNSTTVAAYGGRIRRKRGLTF